MTTTMTCLLPRNRRGIADGVFTYSFQASDVSPLNPVLLHSQKKPQKVSLLFEDEDDDFNGGLFGAKRTTTTSSVAPQTNVS